MRTVVALFGLAVAAAFIAATVTTFDTVETRRADNITVGVAHARAPVDHAHSEPVQTR